MENWKIFAKGLILENPILVLALSLCPAIAVTSSVMTAITMGLTVTYVITLNNVVVSLIKNFVNPKVRVPIYITSIATIVTIAVLVLKAYAPSLYKELGIYLELVVVFAIILARAEVFASKNSVGRSFLDGFGMGCGFLGAMVIIGAIREVLGNGTFLGFSVFGQAYDPALIMILPPGGFILIGYLVALFKMINDSREKRQRIRGESA
ncbi:MAG: electron transport complex subunit RsxE [Desulfitobacteriaceae bacterium]|nr:electron transport complex subunit RsxE [Desulfitobacteriaceae bacterium]MDD4345979.1 electron transport complex subunit RsxE [Desulfitobacteriaceae bacterium]MDD4401010.1 electron transport complex subunit RsxE [Desulfitobacteriaceae bacterium]